MARARPAAYPAWAASFLEHFASTGVIAYSAQKVLKAKVAGAPPTSSAIRRALLRLRESSPVFGEDYDLAREDAIDYLEVVARDRATRGMSDVLLIFLLKSQRPAIYRENVRHEVTGKDGGPVVSIDGIRALVQPLLDDARSSST